MSSLPIAKLSNRVHFVKSQNDSQSTLVFTTETMVIGITKMAGNWKMVKDLNSALFLLELPRQIHTATKYYVFRFDFNEFEKCCDCFQVALFSNLNWAKEYGLNGFVRCTERKCIHGIECKQLRPKITDRAPNWEIGYFIIGNKKIYILKHTYRYARESREDLPTDRT